MRLDQTVTTLGSQTQLHTPRYLKTLNEKAIMHSCQEMGEKFGIKKRSIEYKKYQRKKLRNIKTQNGSTINSSFTCRVSSERGR